MSLGALSVGTNAVASRSNKAAQVSALLVSALLTMEGTSLEVANPGGMVIMCRLSMTSVWYVR